MSTKKDSIRLSTYDELFSSPPKPQKSSLKKFKSFKRRSVQLGKGAELFAALQKQRVVIDEKAIHFVAEARTGKRADARNSVFKLAQKYQILPDRERVQRIKQLYGKVKENEDSGDEAWDNSCTKLPGKLDPDAYLRLVRKEDIKDHQHLLNEMEEINQETAALSEDVCTPEGITDQDRLNELEMIIEENEKKQHSSSSPSSSSPPSSSSESELNKTEEEGEEENHKTSDDDEDDSDLEFDEEDMKTLNSLQREFVGNNLYQWFKEIQKTYESGVKLVKVNRMGYKFIRIVTIKDMVRNCLLNK
ncbi:hypothetical protein, conserved [Eimeria maxima]|uniref:Uncharacterized protein n=1 Tax=Eimeria maxima TaxID=5804 RepID=U6MAJ8_EIMMA|nr:hypothetical protein, conserved [Eimeria maxima]CDJ61247.1 hypothetical protein, conserved [Eimeria maxima]